LDDATFLFINNQIKYEFEEIASLKREQWRKWVQGKIDQRDFRNLVLKLEKTGQREIDLAEMEEELKPQ
jgi:chemotaxis regulatin CheY-phosphate phosphatase CheZ